MIQESITDLEKNFCSSAEYFSIEELKRLIRILQKERDSWCFNAKQLQKQMNEIEPLRRDVRKLAEIMDRISTAKKKESSQT